jgi:hypothetical protein
MTTPPEMLIVGQLYDPGRRSWPQRADYNFRGGEHELRIFMRDVSRTEVEAVRTGPVEFGLWVVDPTLLMIIPRFHDPSGQRVVMTFDCSYCWWRVDPSERTTPPAWEHTKPALGALCHTILVEATNGIVLALRATTFPPAFTQMLHKAMAEQSTASYDREAHERLARRILQDFNTDLLWARCTVRCRAGD